MTGERLSNRSRRCLWIACAAVLALGCAGCNPSLDIDGALLPAWIIAGGIGIALTVAARALFARTGVDRHLIARPLVYLALAITFTCVTWLTLFRF